MLDMKGTHDVCRRVYSTEGKAPTVNTCSGGNREPKVFSRLSECLKVREATSKGYAEINVDDCVDLQNPTSKTRRGRSMTDKSNCLQTSNEFYQYLGTIKAPIYEVKGGMITVKGKQYPHKAS